MMRLTSVPLALTAILAVGASSALAQSAPSGPYEMEPGMTAPPDGGPDMRPEPDAGREAREPGPRPDGGRAARGMKQGQGGDRRGPREMGRMAGHMGPGMLRMMVILMDTDDDGALSLQEVQDVHARIFRAIDADGDERVTLEEMEDFFSAMRGPSWRD